MLQMRKVGAVLAGALVATGAFAQATASYDTTNLAAQLTTDIGNAASTMFPVLVVSIGLVIGWRYIRRFAKGV